MKYAMGVVGLGVMGAEPRAQHREPRLSGRRLRPRCRQGAGLPQRPGQGQGRRHRRHAAEVDGDARTAAADPHDGPRREAGRQRHRAPQAAPRGRRHPDRRRQFALRRHRPPLGRARGRRISLRRRRSLRRRGRRAARAGDHARRSAPRVGRAGANPQGNCRQGRGWRAVRRVHGPEGRRALRQDGAQRHRVRRHAAHRRGLRRPAARRRSFGRRDRRHLRRVERSRSSSRT